MLHNVRVNVHVRTLATHLVILSSKLATMLFMLSNGFSSPARVTPPSFVVSALSALTRLGALGRKLVEPYVRFPVLLSCGNAVWILAMTSLSA